MKLLRLFLNCFVLLLLAIQSQSQEEISDSAYSLQQVLVRGFATQRTVLETPASISKIGRRDLQRASGVSLVPAISSVPGVRMEERSPGSYRLSIRGSLLRAPFGIRNIKVYMQDFILTDAGGNTYLNLLDLNAVGGVEIIRGPASSIYGTGTGGAVLVDPPTMPHAEDKSYVIDAQLGAGGFGLFSESFRVQQSGRFSWQLNQGHLQSEGYRENSRLRRDAVQGNFGTQTGTHNRIDGLLLFSSLDYRTPGGLTLAQATADPRQARPATPVAPGAAEQKAGITNQSLLTGLSDRWQFAPQWSWISSLTFMYTDFANPFITNYETRNEANLGLRSYLQYQSKAESKPLRWLIGLEWQRGNYRIDSTGNSGGKPSGPSVEDRVVARQQFLFTQLEWSPVKRFWIQAGISLNDFHYTLERVSGNPQWGTVPLSFDLVPAPRLALMYALTGNVYLHGSASRGFSPPSIAEVRPSAGGFDTDLQAEYGWNFEAGVKAKIWRNRMRAECTAFRFDLNDAIVRRTNAAGAEFFVNAGGTEQQGLEAFLEGYLLSPGRNGWLGQIRLWSSVTLSRFRFSEYQSGNNDFSGNKLTGVPATGVVSGMDLRCWQHLSILTTFQYTDPIPLNDANSVYADAWRLWTIRAEWTGKWRSGAWTLFAGIDNIGNESYSLGNDLNAFGQRYYNPAATLNGFGGIRFRWYRSRSGDASKTR